MLGAVSGALHLETLSFIPSLYNGLCLPAFGCVSAYVSPCLSRSHIVGYVSIGKKELDQQFRELYTIVHFICPAGHRYGMSQHAPGKHFRKGISLFELFEMFPDNKTAEKWFESRIWRNGRTCSRCGYDGTVQSRHPTMPYYCSRCRKRFSIKTGTVMEASNVSYRKWAIVTYQFATNLKGISSMKIHRDLHVTQKTAWFIVQRLRESWRTLAGADAMEGPVEIDEAFIGGREKNKHADKKHTTKKTAVVGIKDRETKTIRAKPVPETTAARLGKFIQDNATKDSKKYTDDNKAYAGLENHEAVRHSVKEYVRGTVHTNGIESSWALLKRGYHGTFHHVSAEHLHHYVNEFAGRLNTRDMDTISMVGMMAENMSGKRLTYAALTETGTFAMRELEAVS